MTGCSDLRTGSRQNLSWVSTSRSRLSRSHAATSQQQQQLLQQRGVSQLPLLAGAPTTLSSSRDSFVCQAAATAVAPAPAVGAVRRGETAGAVLVLEDATVQAGERDLLTDASWKLMPGQRAGLVGANGAGKSTLLKAIAGLRGVDSGKLLIANNVSLGYLAQTAVSGSTRTVYEEVRNAMQQLVAAEAAMVAAAALFEAGDPDAPQKLADAQADFEAAGGYDVDRRIGTVLDGLGFTREQWDLGCDRFSGGWQMRIALACMLLSPAGQAATGSGSSGSAGVGGGLLLLDEPTNHLDAKAVAWLAQFLAASAATLVLVSHDEGLLEGACDRIVEVRGRRLHHYVGSYSKFLQQREERATLAAATAATQAAEIKRLEDFVARFGAKASKAAEAQSKLKLLEKLRKEAAVTAEPLSAASGSGPGDARKVTLRFPSPPACYTDVLSVQGLAVGWGAAPNSTTPNAAEAAGAHSTDGAAAAASADEDADSAAAAAVPARLVLQDVNFTVQKGQRVLVLGPNGAGKSTLMKTLSGRLQPWSGSVSQGQGVKLGIFDQDLAQELPLDQTALNYVSKVARKTDPSLTLEKVRAALGALGLTGSLALQQIGSLSGGEKARVALAVFALVPANVLLLDEASNHLDAATLEVLTGALKNFTGAVVAITHNQAFATALQPTHVLRVAGGSAKLSEHSGALSSKDFEHSTPSSSSSNGSGKTAGSIGNGKVAGKSSSTGKRGKGKAPAAAATAAAAAPAASKDTTAKKASSSSSGSNGGSGAASSNGSTSSSSSKPARKRTTLSYSERIQYEKLCKELDELNKQRASLEAKVSQLAQASGDLAALEAASMQLAAVADKADEAELQWLELAELAGDL